MENKIKTVVLFSGGLDSSTVLLFLVKKNFYPYPLFIDFGQKSARQEWKACKRVAEFLDIKTLKKVKLREIYKFGIEKNNGFIFHRNAFLVIIGAMYAASKGIKIISAGLTSYNPDFPDTSKSFIEETEKLVNVSLGAKNLIFYNPLYGLSKEEIILYSTVNGLPLQFTYSCYRGKNLHCGKCSGCKLRKNGFKNIKFKDSTTYLNSSKKSG